MTDADRLLLRERANGALRTLAGLPGPNDLASAKDLVLSLRNAREYELMGNLAEAVSRLDPKDATNRRLYAQYLIDTGKVTAALDLLRPLARLPKEHKEYSEATGLIGRSYKQIFFDAGDKTSPGAREALARAIESYRRPFDADPAKNTWHGVNLLALLTRARRLGLRMAPDVNLHDLAQRVVTELEAKPESERDEWYLPTLAEACLGLNDWPRVEATIRQYADVSKPTPSFLIASTLRQFIQVWDLEQVDERGRSLVDILRARVACMSDGVVQVSAERVVELRAQDRPDDSQLQAVLGPGGLETYAWWVTGRERALSVGAVRRKLGTRKGTGFLVRAGDLGLEPAEELLFLTNYHVVNDEARHNALRPVEAEVVFEAGAPQQKFSVQILWSSPVDKLDACVLRLTPAVTGLVPLPISSELPPIASDPRTSVYVIGHPAAGELSFSFRGNHLLDHEGPTAGNPPDPHRWRLHYTATTKGGSSGSPVFDAMWGVIALHHAGLETGMRMLNGKSGEYGANEGIAMQSIVAAPKA
jgi:hypothetical protein